MRKVLIFGLVIMVTACNSGQEKNADERPVEVGNSAGADVIAQDTLKMDTSAGSISPR